MSRISFLPKNTSATVNLVFDFAAMLAAGETISTKQTFAKVYSGVDANPQAIINGAASSSGTQVTQSVTGGVAGTVYWLRCEITTSASQTLELEGALVVQDWGQL